MAGRNPIDARGHESASLPERRMNPKQNPLFKLFWILLWHCLSQGRKTCDQQEALLRINTHRAIAHTNPLVFRPPTWSKPSSMEIMSKSLANCS